MISHILLKYGNRNEWNWTEFEKYIDFHTPTMNHILSLNRITENRIKFYIRKKKEKRRRRSSTATQKKLSCKKNCQKKKNTTDESTERIKKLGAEKNTEEE